METIQITFSPPDYGWIELHISANDESYCINCSSIADPFRQFMVWLEQIATGAEHAIWHIEEEGDSSRLMFLSGSPFLGDEQSYLLHCRSSGQMLREFSAVPIERGDLVRHLYGAFRLMVERANYDPRQWEMHPRWHEIDLHDEAALDAAMEDWPFGGLRLSLLRSATVESFLASEGGAEQQLELALAFR